MTEISEVLKSPQILKLSFDVVMSLQTELVVQLVGVVGKTGVIEQPYPIQTFVAGENLEWFHALHSKHNKWHDDKIYEN